MFKRLREFWKKTWSSAGRRDWSKIKLPEKIYVYPSEFNPNKFVQLLNYRDAILALDAEGKVWKIDEDWSGFGLHIQGCPIITSPRSSY